MLIYIMGLFSVRVGMTYWYIEERGVKSFGEIREY